jgi:hypothetical protein
MKRLATVGAVCLSFLMTGAVTALAQDEHRDREEEHKQEERNKDEHKEAEHKEARQEERHDEHAVKREEHVEHRRIADEHFRAHFGREHHFAVRNITVVNNERRFEYGGYRFGFAEPWPVGWAYTDDVYIDFIDGEYYLFNVRHPGVRIMVNVLP